MPDARTGCRGEGGDGADEGIVCPAYEGQLDRWSRCPDEGLLLSPA